MTPWFTSLNSNLYALELIYFKKRDKLNLGNWKKFEKAKY